MPRMQLEAVSGVIQNRAPSDLRRTGHSVDFLAVASSLVDHLSAPNQRSQTQALDKIRYESITDPDKIEAGSASAGSNPLRHVGSQIRVYRMGLLSSSSSREKSWSSEGLALTGCCREAVRSGSDRRQATGEIH